MIPDGQLLRQYADDGSEAAFAELVRRYIDLVYSVALRQAAGDTALAQDVTQMVFVDLARKSRLLCGRPTLSGWLHTSARFAASKAIRGEQRRRAREQESLAMENHPAHAEMHWEQLRPLLDESIGRLTEADRDAIVLRFFQSKSHLEIGAILGLSENSANKRVERALEKLRGHFTHRGITTTSAILAATIGANSVQAAPSVWAQQLAPHALAVAGASSGSALLTTLTMILKSPAFLAVAATALVVTGVALGMSAKPALSSATPPPSASSAPRTVPPLATSSSPRAMLPPTLPAAPAVSVAASTTSPANTTATAPHRAEADMPQAIIDTFLTQGFPGLQTPNAIAGLQQIYNSGQHVQNEVKTAIAANATITALTENDTSLPSLLTNMVMTPFYADPPLDVEGATFDNMLRGILRQAKPEDAPALQAFAKMLAADPVIQTANQASLAGLAEFHNALAAAISTYPDGSSLVDENPDVLNAVTAMFVTQASMRMPMHMPDKDLTLQQVADGVGKVTLDMMPTSSNLAKMRSSRGRSAASSRPPTPAGS